MTMCHVALYCRRSVDPADLGVSVAVQEKACRRYAAEHWPDLPVVAYVDNDLSAANPGVHRPRYAAMVDAIRAGRVAQVVVREQSRLTRQVDQWEALCTTLQVAKIDAVHQTHGGPVSVTEGSRLPGRIMAVVDAEYVEQVKVKVKLALESNAEDGRPHGRPGYGYRRDEVDGRVVWEPDEQTAPIARRVVAEVAAGDSLGLVATRLNQEGVPTPRGAKRWAGSTVRSIVTAPRLIGQRVHLGSLSPATWPPIVDEGIWRKAQARLGQNPAGTTAADRRRYLLTGGLAVCDACDTPLISSTTPVRGERVPSYQCPHPSRPDGGCGHCSILAGRLEDHVTAQVGEWLATPAFVAALNHYLSADALDVAPIREELADVEARLAHLAAQWAAGEILELENHAARRGLLARRSDLMAELDRHPAPVSVTAEQIAQGWEDGDVQVRRGLVRVVAGPIRVVSAFADGRRLTTAERVAVHPAWSCP